MYPGSSGFAITCTPTTSASQRIASAAACSARLCPEGLASRNTAMVLGSRAFIAAAAGALRRVRGTLLSGSLAIFPPQRGPECLDRFLDVLVDCSEVVTRSPRQQDRNRRLP